MNYNTYPQQPYMQQAMNYRPAQQTQYGNWGNANPGSPQVRPVASIEEVKACPIDFDGSVFYFPDLANKKIYTKQINMDGTAAINMYELKEMPMQKESSQLDLSHFVTKEELEQALFQVKELIGGIQGKVAEISPKEKPVISF